ncbi:MAG: hypothetical protein HY556_01585 [Euryarchaeota archaeon]|nr:hypothetical protein [Euryarchaeota archaeon]
MKMRPAVPIAATLLLVVAQGASGSGVVTVDVLFHDGGGHETPYHIAPSEFNATEGDLLVLTVVNPGGNQQGHDLVVERHRDAKTMLLQPGKSETLRFTAGPAGNHTYYCTVPGHREAGMAGTMRIAAGPVGDEGDGKRTGVAPVPGVPLPLLLIGVLLLVRARRRRRAI